jgi:hypothetical protein
VGVKKQEMPWGFVPSNYCIDAREHKDINQKAAQMHTTAKH